MYSISAVVIPPTPTTTQQAPVASLIVPEAPVIGRLPVNLVPAPVADAEIRPRERTQQQKPPPAANAPATVSNLEIAESDGGEGPSPTGRITAFPTLFFAQLIAQNPGAPAQSILQSYESAYAPRGKESQKREGATDASLLGTFAALMSE